MEAVGVGCTHHGLIQSSNLEPLGHLSIDLTRRQSNKFLESKINKDHLNFWSHILGWVDQNRNAPELVFGAWCCRDLPCGLAIRHCPSIAAPPTLPNFNHRDKKPSTINPSRALSSQRHCAAPPYISRCHRPPKLKFASHCAPPPKPLISPNRIPNNPTTETHHHRPCRYQTRHWKR